MSEIVSTAPQEEVVSPAVPAGGAATPAPKAESAPAPGAVAPAIDPNAVKPEPKPAETPEDAAKRKQRQKTDRLYRERATALAERDFYKNQAEAARRPPAPPDPSAPKSSDFTDIGEFEKAVREHERMTGEQARASKQREDQAQATHRQVTESWTKSAARGEEKYQDWDEVVGDLPPPNNAALAALMTAENAHDLVYHLKTNQEDFARINALPELQAIVAIGALSAKLAAQPPKAPALSKAPPPIEPVGAGNISAHKALSEIDDFDEFTKRRKEQIKKRR